MDRYAALTPESVAFMRGLLERYGSFCLGVPHNVAGILYSIRLTRELPTLVLMKNSNSEPRDRTSRDFWNRVGVDAFMTRSVWLKGSPPPIVLLSRVAPRPPPSCCWFP